MAKFVNGKGDYLSIKSQTDLNLDGLNYNYFKVTLSGNASFSGLDTLIIGRPYYVGITNANSSMITIPLPNTADIFNKPEITINAEKNREIQIVWDGSKRSWHGSAERKIK